MCTVTLPSEQIHSDKAIKRHCLVPFIDSLKYHYDIKHYFWRAEKQQNGNIHFHILFDRYLPKEHVQGLWNMATERLKYVTRFARKHKHFNPPTTKLNYLDNVKKGIRYVLKYVTKQDPTLLVDGKLWGMSDSIRTLRQFTHRYYSRFNQVIERYLIDEKKPYYFAEHYLSISLGSENKVLEERNMIYQDYYHRLLQIYSYLYFTDNPFDSDPTAVIYQGLEEDEIKLLTTSIN